MASEPETVSGEKAVRLSHRFALGTWNLSIILIAIVLISGWVMIRRNDASSCRLRRPLRVGIVPWAGYAGGLVANNGLRPNKDSDFWKKENLLVEFVLVENERDLLEGLKRGGDNGGLDVIWSTVDALARQYPVLADDDARAFMQVDWSIGGDAIVVANYDIKRIEDLKYKKIAVSKVPSRWLLEFSLKNSSLTWPEQVATVTARDETGGSKDARQEFEDRQVEAAVLWEPDVSEALQHRPGSHILVGTDTFDKLIADVMVAKEDFIKHHHDDVAAFMRGWLLDGTPKALSDPMLATRVLQHENDFAELGEAKTRELLGKVTLATLEDNVEMFGLLNPNNAHFDRIFKEANSLSFKHGDKDINPETQPEQVRDVELLKEIYNSQSGSAPETGCNSIVMSKQLTVPFQPFSNELQPEGKQALDDKEVSSMIRTSSGARFCVQVVANEPGNIQDAAAIAKARTTAVIDYLALHYDRPRSEFLFTSVLADHPTGTADGTHNVLLSLVGLHATSQTKPEFLQNGP